MNESLARVIEQFKVALKNSNSEQNIFQLVTELEVFLETGDHSLEPENLETYRQLAKDVFTILQSSKGVSRGIQTSLLRLLNVLLSFGGTSLVNELCHKTSEILRETISSSKIFIVESAEELQTLKEKAFYFCSQVILNTSVVLHGSKEQQKELIKELCTGKCTSRIMKSLRKPLIPQLEVVSSSHNKLSSSKSYQESYRNFQVGRIQSTLLTSVTQGVFQLLSHISLEKSVLQDMAALLHSSTMDYCDQVVNINLFELLLSQSNVLGIEISVPSHLISYSHSEMTVLEYLTGFIQRAVRKSKASSFDVHQKWCQLYAICKFEQHQPNLRSFVRSVESSTNLLKKLLQGDRFTGVPSIVQEIGLIQDMDSLHATFEHYLYLISRTFSSEENFLPCLYYVILLNLGKEDSSESHRSAGRKRTSYEILYSQLSLLKMFVDAWEKGFIENLNQQNCMTIFYDILRVNNELFVLEESSIPSMVKASLILATGAQMMHRIELDSSNKLLKDMIEQIIQKSLTYRSASLRYASCMFLSCCGILYSGLRQSLITELLQLVKIADLELCSSFDKVRLIGLFYENESNRRAQKLSPVEFRQMYGSLLSRILGYSAGITSLLLEETDELGLPGGLLGQIFSDAVALLRPHAILKVSLPQTAESIRRRAGWVLIASLMKTRVSRFLESAYFNSLLTFWHKELSLNASRDFGRRTNVSNVGSDYSAQEASAASARLSSLAAMYYVLQFLDKREAPPHFHISLSILLSSCAVRVAETWQALQREESSGKSGKPLCQLFSLCEAFWLSKCATHIQHSALSVDACLRVTLAIVHSYGRESLGIKEKLNTESFENFLITFFGSLGAELPSTEDQLQVAINSSAILLTAQEGRHPLWIELSFPVSAKDYRLSPLVSSQMGFAYASQFRIEKQALDGWCLSRVQASLWVLLNVAISQRLKETQSPWDVSMNELELGTSFYYISCAFSELGRNGDDRLHDELIVNLCRIILDKNASASSLYETWRKCICVVSLSLLLPIESLEKMEEENDSYLSVAEAIQHAVESSHIAIALTGNFAVMKCFKLFRKEPQKILSFIFQSWSRFQGAEMGDWEHIRVFISKHMEWFPQYSSHPIHFPQGDCLLTICVLNAVDSLIREWFADWIKHQNVDALNICSILLWECSKWDCCFIQSILLDCVAWIRSWSLQHPQEEKIDRISYWKEQSIPFASDMEIVDKAINILEQKSNGQSNNDYLLMKVTHCLGRMCDGMDTSDILERFPSLPELLIELIDRNNNCSTELKYLLQKIAGKGPINFWIDFCLRAYRGGLKPVLFSVNQPALNESEQVHEYAMESGLVEQNNRAEYWRLRGRTKDLLMEIACELLNNCQDSLEFFVTQSVQLILIACQSLRMASIIESFRLIQPLGHKIEQVSPLFLKGMMLQLSSAIRMVLSPEQHPMIVVAAAEAAMEWCCSAMVQQDECINAIIPPEKIEYLTSYWQYERWSEPVGVVTLFSMLRCASEWFSRSVGRMPMTLESRTFHALQQYFYGVIGDFAFILAGHSWMFEKWGCSIATDGVYRNKWIEIFWKDGTRFIRNMLLSGFSILIDEQEGRKMAWKQTQAPGTKLAESINDNEKTEILVAICHVWLKHLIEQFPNAQDSVHFQDCLESNLIVAIVYHQQPHVLLGQVLSVLLQQPPSCVSHICENVFAHLCSMRTLEKASTLLNVDYPISDCLCYLANTCHTIWNDGEEVSYAWKKCLLLINALPLSQEILAKLQMPLCCMFLMGICGLFYLVCHKIIPQMVNVGLSLKETEQPLMFPDRDWYRCFSFIAERVDSTRLLKVFNYCVNELLHVRQLQMMNTSMLMLLSRILYAMLNSLSNSLPVLDRVAALWTNLENTYFISHVWIPLIVLPALDILKKYHKEKELADLWQTGWKYLLQNVGKSSGDDFHVGWLQLCVHLKEIVSVDTIPSSWITCLILHMTVELILQQTDDSKEWHPLGHELLQLVQKHEALFRQVVQSLKQTERATLQKILRNATNDAIQ
eukprot:jgi/Galph1/2646/GphlegSOOS_G1282.1